MESILGEVALVTGGGRNIGLACASTLAQLVPSYHQHGRWDEVTATVPFSRQTPRAWSPNRLFILMATTHVDEVCDGSSEENASRVAVALQVVDARGDHALRISAAELCGASTSFLLSNGPRHRA